MLSRVRIATAALLLCMLILFAASVGPSLSWTDTRALGVAWTQFSGILSVGSMAIVIVLAARPRLLERPMDGLDKMYRLHKWLGIIAIVFGIAHWLTATGEGHRPRPSEAAVAPALATTTLDAPASGATSLIPQSLIGPAHQYAEPLLFLLIALGLVALIRLVPYRWFAKTHILVVPVFLFFVFHSVVLMKTSYWSLPIAWVTLLLLALGTLAALYAVLHYFGLTRKGTATVVSSRYYPEIRVLEMIIEVKRGWNGHRPGQFAFVTINRSEGAHPFTIASNWNPADRRIRFVAKELGDHTARLRDELKQGQNVYLEGPYGCFTFDDTKKRQIWIGAGIGITPFIARMLERASQPDGREVDLFHSTRDESPEALRRMSVDAAAGQTALHILISPRDGKLDFRAIADAVPDWQNASVWFCGPPLFAASLRHEFVAAGLSPKDWHQELFEMR